MKLSLGGGVEFDFATSDEVKDASDSLFDRIMGGMPGLPRYPVLPGSVADASISSAFISFGVPPDGHVWDILGLTTSGADDHTAVTGTCALYAGNSGVLSNGNGASLGDLRVPLISVPFYDDFGPRRLIVQQGQELFMTFAGFSAGAHVNVNVYVAEWSVNDFMGGGLR